MNAKHIRAFLGMGLVGSLTLLPLSAAPVTGQLNIGGNAQVAATFLNFLCNGAITPLCPAGYGNFIATNTGTGSFALYDGDTGFVHNINEMAQPVNQAFSLANFLVFNPGGLVPSPDIALDLNFIFLGVDGQAQCGTDPNAASPGQICTPVIPALVTASNPFGLSPFNLQNTQTGSTATFSVGGTARRISTGENSQFTGLFTASFSSTPGTHDRSYQALLGTISTGGSVTGPFASSFDATIVGTPEPGTVVMMLGGMALLAFASIRRRSKA